MTQNIKAATKFKITFVGDQNVGKTSIISRFIQDSFEATSNPTVGIDFITKTMQVSGQTVRLQLWDTAGQQRFRSLIPSYIRDADLCLIVTDLGVVSSFHNLDKWMDFVRDVKGIQQSLIWLVGNKSDLQQIDRQVSKQSIQQFALKQGCKYTQVSAKSGSNISNLFRNISETLVYQKITKIKQKAQLQEQQKQKKKITLTKEVHIQSQNQPQGGCSC